MIRMPREVREGDPVLYTEWNLMVAAMRQLRLLDSTDGGIVLDRTHDGTTPRIGAPFTEVRPAQAPAGGVPAKVGNTPGSAVCTLFTWDGASHAIGVGTLTVLNDYPGAVAANKLIKIYRWRGAWWVGMESCT